MRAVMIAIGFLLVSQAALAAVLHVPADYPTIGAATAVAVSGDEVLVAAGTYNERFTLGPGQDGVKIHSESGPAVTIIDGGYTGSVVSMSSVGSGTELIGFTISHGGHSPSTVDLGGAIRLDGASPLINNNIITLSSALQGSLYLNGGSPTITNNVFDQNASQRGGGIYVAMGSPTIQGNTFTNNQATAGSGGGVSVSPSSSATIENNVFEANHALNFGGAIFLNGSPTTSVKGNHFTTNSAGFEGGAMYVTNALSLSIQENLFQGNTTNRGAAGAVALESDDGCTIENNQFLGNSGASAAGAVYVYDSSVTIRGNLVQDNDCPHGSAGGIYFDHSSGTVEQNIVLRNHCVAWGGGISIWASTPALTSNTIALNKGDQGGGNVYLRGGASSTLNRNILSHSPNEGLDLDAVDGPVFATLNCNDVSNNAGGNYTGLADPTGTSGNISSDPLFCDLATLDVHLSMGSPCTAANAPAGCGLIGALDVNCEGPVPTQVTTWGGLKARYR